MRRAIYEIYNKNGKWTWRLRSDEDILAYSGKTFSRSSDAWWEVDRVRALAAKLAGVNAYRDVPLNNIPSMEVVHADELDSYLQSMQPRWVELESGVLFNAAEVNDVESTEMIRRQLAGKEKILPFVYLRDERRGRSYSFVKYLNHLFEKGYIDEVFMGGRTTKAFARNIRAPIRQFRADADAGEVLDEMVRVGLPVILMGNTVDEFMRQMEIEISKRVVAGDNVHYSPEVDTLEEVGPINSNH